MICNYKSNNASFGYNIQAGGFLPGKMSELTKNKIGAANTIHRKIYSYDRNTGEFLKAYETLSDATKDVGFKDNSSVSAVCNYRCKSRKGIIFRYADTAGLKYGEPLPAIEMEKSGNTRLCPILQYTTDGKFIKRWQCIRDAELAFGHEQGKTLIWHCCNDKKPTALGYIWRYENELFVSDKDWPDHIPIPYSKVKRRIVNQYDLQGNYIASFSSTGEAARKTGSSQGSISAVCCRKAGHYTSNNFIWRYDDDDEFKCA